MPSHCTGGLGTHLSWNTIRVIVSAIVVVDPAKVADVTLPQVADYAAMVGLAQVREGATPGAAPTILHLFDRDNASKPASLTPYDQAFLKSLYTTHVSETVQESEIETQMYEAVTR